MLGTYETVKKWFDCLERKDYDSYYELIDDDITWINLRTVEGVNDCLPWLGELRGKEAVLKSYGVFGEVAALVPGSFVLHDIHVDGDTAIAHLHEKMKVHKNGAEYAIDGTFLMRVTDGKVVYWESFWDPSGAIKAIKGD